MSDYTHDMFAGQIRRWTAAADAYRRRDADTVAELLARRDQPDRDAYRDTITSTALGACLCAAQLARLNHHPLDFNTVAEQIAGYATPDMGGAERITDVVMELLKIYTALTEPGRPWSQR